MATKKLVFKSEAHRKKVHALLQNHIDGDGNIEFHNVRDGSKYKAHHTQIEHHVAKNGVILAKHTTPEGQTLYRIVGRA